MNIISCIILKKIKILINEIKILINGIDNKITNGLDNKLTNGLDNKIIKKNNLYYKLCNLIKNF